MRISNTYIECRLCRITLLHTITFDICIYRWYILHLYTLSIISLLSIIIHMYIYIYVYPEIPTTNETMGVDITTIAYLRVLIIEIGSTIILMVVEAQGIYIHIFWGWILMAGEQRLNSLVTELHRQRIQVSSMEVLYLIFGCLGGWGFPHISRRHTAYIGEDSSTLSTWNVWWLQITAHVRTKCWCFNNSMVKTGVEWNYHGNRRGTLWFSRP